MGLTDDRPNSSISTFDKENSNTVKSAPFKVSDLSEDKAMGKGGENPVQSHSKPSLLAGLPDAELRKHAEERGLKSDGSRDQLLKVLVLISPSFFFEYILYDYFCFAILL
mmetsp:Transcript_5315/g.6971  ORF Transcript_5315/g.6971 Transcript_5315/m.6971 type:complete len:110 (-) Transcript_5315:1256-1585(-)